MQQRAGEREQARVLQSQIERMSQQIDYQLQRASLRKSGLVRHNVLLLPVLESLCSTLDKVYRDKRVEVELDVPAQSHVPIEQGRCWNCWAICWRTPTGSVWGACG